MGTNKRGLLTMLAAAFALSAMAGDNSKGMKGHAKLNSVSEGRYGYIGWTGFTGIRPGKDRKKKNNMNHLSIRTKNKHKRAKKRG